jgi:methylated-DNA-[protein]-cysteine S-methyltransferase
MSRSESDAIGRALRKAARSDAESEAVRLAERFAERADREGLADVAYATLDTPLGVAVVAATERGLVRLGLPNERPERVLDELAADVSPRLLELPARLDEERRELEEYFAGRRTRFELALDWRLTRSGFMRRVLRATARVPYGDTSTYAEVAERAGNPRAYRAAGSALGSNPIPIVVPCHRILRSGGDIGQYGGGPEMKEYLLRLEGATFAR